MSDAQIVNNRLGTVAADAFKLVCERVELKSEVVMVSSLMAVISAKEAGYSLEMLLEGIRGTWELKDKKKPEKV